MVGETNSMVGCHLMAEDHSVHLGVWGGGRALNPPAGQGSALVGVGIF